jgi:uncharacterized protein YjbI with pentapeptide repeats
MANPKHLKILKQGVEAWNKWRSEHRSVHPNLSSANLRGADLRGADFSFSNLIKIDLSNAMLFNTDFSESDLSYANLSNARLFFINLNRADLIGADFTDVRLALTAFADNDLSEVKGLETVICLRPSSIGVDTLYKSAGKIPEAFLRWCGVPDDFIAFIPSHFGVQ